MSAYLNAWISTQGFMPHGHCYLWMPSLLWLHVVSDALIFIAYVSIPATLVSFVRRRNDVPFDWMFLCFSVFIVSCGLTHLLAVWTVWRPSYWLSGAVKALTAVASLATAWLLVRLVPTALTLPSPSKLREVVAALKASDARFRAAAEGGQDAFYILEACRDAGGRVSDFTYVYANARTRARLPVPAPADLSGQRISAFFPLAAIKEVLDLFVRVMDGGSAAEEVVLLTLPGVPSRWLQLQVVPLGSGVAVTSRDITERKLAEDALRRAEERFRAMLEGTPDAIVIVNEQGEVVFINTQATQLFRYTPNELIGEKVEVLVPPTSRALHAERRGGYSSAPTARSMGLGLELTGRRKDGSEFPVEISLRPLQTEGGLLIASAIRDVSARKWTENALRLSNQELEAFSYSVAHDLRAPLRGMSGFAQILLEDHADALDEEGKDCLQEIQQNAKRMSELIDALLSLSRVSRSALHMEPVDLSALARAVTDELARQEPERKVEVRVQPSLSAQLDPALARTLLANLIDNAWKFTRQAPSPRIEVGESNEAGGRAFFVRDNGAGFDAAFATKLFTPFQRLHGASEFPGTGIGLATVRRIVHRHGGQVWAKGRVGEGATFFFQVPDAAPGAQA